MVNIHNQLGVYNIPRELDYSPDLYADMDDEPVEQGPQRIGAEGQFVSYESWRTSWRLREEAWDGSTPLLDAWNQRLGARARTFTWQWQPIRWNGHLPSLEPIWDAHLANIQGERKTSYELEVVMMPRLTSRLQRVYGAWFQGGGWALAIELLRHLLLDGYGRRRRQDALRETGFDS